MKLFIRIIYLVNLSLLPFPVIAQNYNPSKIFDVHLHAQKDMNKQLQDFKKYNIIRGAFSSSWDNVEKYRTVTGVKLLFGLMFPCPNGIVPYSGQKCFNNGKEFPDVNWVKQQILDKKIDFLGELLNEYYGVSPADSIMFPYYALAREFNLPVGIHTGGVGPGNLCPNVDSSMGNPILMKDILIKFPGLKIWIMHAGLPYLKETLTILAAYPQVYADISVIANPDIKDKDEFQSYMKSLINAGFENRLMFGSDNGDYTKMIKAVNELDFLTFLQKEKIFYKNADRFFGNK
jgi:hypothetical protein